MLTWLQRILVIACGLKAVDCADRAGLVLTAGWLLVAVLISRDPRFGAFTVPLVVLGLDVIRNEHMWVYGFAGVLLTLLAVDWLNEPTARLAACAQVSIVYFFAGFSKINPDWLSGDRVEQTVNVPVGRFAAVVAASVVACEVGLAVAVWLAPRVLWVGGAALHAGMVLLLPDDAGGAVRLGCFAVVLFALYPSDPIPGRSPRLERRPVIGRQLRVAHRQVVDRTVQVGAGTGTDDPGTEDSAVTTRP